MQKPMDFMDSPVIRRRNAERLIFEVPNEIPRPMVSWYNRHCDGAEGSAPRKSVRLTAEEERVLFRQYNYARFRVLKAQRHVERSRMRPLDQHLDDLLHWSDTAASLRAQIVEINLPLVLAMAKRTRSKDGDFADLVAEGNVALVRSVDKFDCERGFKFSTYACRAILKAFSRYGAKQTRYRQRVPFEFDPELESADGGVHQDLHGGNEPLELIRRVVRENNADLSEVEQEILHYRFGLFAGQNPPRLTLEQVGRRIGMTKERVRQLQNRALEKLREVLDPLCAGELMLN